MRLQLGELQLQLQKSMDDLQKSMDRSVCSSFAQVFGRFAKVRGHPPRTPFAKVFGRVKTLPGRSPALDNPYTKCPRSAHDVSTMCPRSACNSVAKVFGRFAKVFGHRCLKARSGTRTQTWGHPLRSSKPLGHPGRLTGDTPTALPEFRNFELF